MSRFAQKALLGIAVALCVGVVLYLSRPLSFYMCKVRCSSDSSARMVMITTTQACPCGLQRCREVRENLDQMLGQAGGGITLEIIDYATDTESAERMMEKFDVYMVPIVLVLDEDGQAVYRSEWDLDEEALRTQLEYLAKWEAR